MELGWLNRLLNPQWPQPGAGMTPAISTLETSPGSGRFLSALPLKTKMWHHPKPSSRLAPAAGQRMCQPCGILVCWDPLGRAGSDLFSPAVARYPLHCFPSAAQPGRPAEGSEPRQGTELSPAHAKLPARGCSKQNLLKGHLFGLPLQLPEETAIIFQSFKMPGSNVLGRSFPTCSWFVRRLLRSHFLAKKSFSFLLNPG